MMMIIIIIIVIKIKINSLKESIQKIVILKNKKKKNGVRIGCEKNQYLISMEFAGCIKT